MNSKIKLLLAAFAVVTCAQVFAADCADNTYDTRGKKCLKANNLYICNNATVVGSITASSYSDSAYTVGTPGVPGIGGDLAYGAAYDTSGTTFIGNLAYIPFNNVSSLTSGVILPASGGTTFTIVNTGFYRITYSVTIKPGAASVYPISIPFTCQVVNVNTGSPLNGSIFSGTYFEDSTGHHSIPAQINGTFLTVLGAGEQIAIQNISGGSIDLYTTSGSNDASLVIERVA